MQASHVLRNNNLFIVDIILTFLCFLAFSCGISFSMINLAPSLIQKFYFHFLLHHERNSNDATSVRRNSNRQSPTASSNHTFLRAAMQIGIAVHIRC